MCAMNRNTPKSKRKAFFFFMMPLMLFGVGALVMVLWNWLMPDLFELKRITYWQAVGLLLLCRILFGGFGFKKGGAHKRWEHGPPPHFREKWKSMSTEEKDAFKAKWKQRWKEHHGHEDTEENSAEEPTSD